MNPYAPPSSGPITQRAERAVRTPLLARLVVGFFTPLIACWWFSANVAPTLTAPLSSFVIAIIVSVVLGLMPGGYGKWDAILGLWLLTLTVCFSLFAWRTYSPSIAPLERTPAFVLIILVFGGGLGGVLATVYALTRKLSKWLFSQRISSNGTATSSPRE
jgi:hypothetical protein